MIKRVHHPHPIELYDARRDEAAVTGQPMVERPYWFEDTETGQMFYDLYGCIGWPTEVSDKGEGMPGYVAVVAVAKLKEERPVQDAPFQLMAEGESNDVPTLLDMIVSMRDAWGFGETPTLLESWYGDPDRYITTIALRNERLTRPILVSPPFDFYDPRAFDVYVRSLQSAIMPERARFYFGGKEILKSKLREFKRDNPAVMAVGGLVHTLLAGCEWMAQVRDLAFTVEEGER